MVSAVFIQVKNRARGNVTSPIIVWSVLMAVVIFMVEASHGAHHDALWVGFGATVLFGVYLGLRRRVAAAFVAPFVSWMVAWIPLWIAEMIYLGNWFSLHHMDLLAYLQQNQSMVSGTIQLKLYKGNCTVMSRESANSLYKPNLITYGEKSEFDQRNGAAFSRMLR